MRRQTSFSALPIGAWFWTRGMSYDGELPRLMKKTSHLDTFNADELLPMKSNFWCISIEAPVTHVSMDTSWKQE